MGSPSRRGADTAQWRPHCTPWPALHLSPCHSDALRDMLSGMPFLKLDCGILNSSLWFEPVTRDVFLTALLLAEPFVTDDPLPQLEPDSLTPTGWVVPPGWYGFIPAAGVGIISRAGVGREEGIQALRQLGSPEQGSRSQEYDGRRLVRVDGGYIALNYDKYRQRDETGAERQRRYRDRQLKRALRVTSTPSRVIVTQEEEEAEVEEEVEVVQEEQERVSRRAALPPLAEAWNTITQRPIARCMGISRKRSTQIAARMAERSLDEWRGIIGRVQASPFCRGQNDRGWVASFDWLIASPDNSLKILEGKYDDRAPAQQPRREPGGSAVPNAEATRKMLDAIYAPDEA